MQHNLKLGYWCENSLFLHFKKLQFYIHQMIRRIWVGRDFLKIIMFNPPWQWGAETSLTVPGWSKPHPALLWMFPGMGHRPWAMGHLQLLWTASSKVLSLLLHKFFSLYWSKSILFQFKTITSCPVTTDPLISPFWELKGWSPFSVLKDSNKVFPNCLFPRLDLERT